MHEHIGKIVKEVREDFGMTQKKLAEILEVSQPWLSAVERGLEILPDKRIDEISDLFQVDIWDIFYYECYEEKKIVTKDNKSGTKHRNSQFNSKQIRQIRQLRLEGVSYRKIAYDFACSRQTIYNIIIGRTYQDVK